MRWRDELKEHLDQELRSRVGGLAGAPAQRITQELTQAAEGVLAAAGLHPIREFQIDAGRFWGRIDLVGCAGKANQPVVAVELDRGNKGRSLEKLAAAAAQHGAMGFWIRWGRNLPSDKGIHVPGGVTLLELPLTYTMAAPLPGSITPWTVRGLG